MLRLNILGAGRAARVIARWLVDSGLVEIGQVANARLTSAEQAVDFIGSGRAVSRIAGLSDDNVLLVGLTDQMLNAAGPDWIDGQPGVAFHLSGSLDSTALKGWARQVASVHPARAFAQPERALNRMPGTWMTAEGDIEALARLESLFLAAGARWQTVARAHKALYHAATVVASNYLVTLTALARDLAQASGFDEADAQDLLAELQSGTLANLDRVDAAKALTGPIERGDLNQIERMHKTSLANHSESGPLLSELGLATLKLAQRARGRKDIDDRIKALLTRP